MDLYLNGRAKPPPSPGGLADATLRTMALLSDSQRLARQLQDWTNELRRNQAELRRSQVELGEKARVLAATSQRKSDILAGMSHELRTPLNSMLTLAQLLAENPEGNLSESEVKSASTIYRAGTNLLQIINDLLDLSKVAAGRMEVRPGPVRVARMVDDLDAAFRPMAAGKGLRFDVEVSPEVPDELFTDEWRLQQILGNLLSNAIKFTSSGTVALRISGEPGTPAVLAFAVSDTGIGIPADLLEAVFEAFRQADAATSRGYGGTGLGLTISRGIASLLGGTIRAESVQGNGSTFTLCLPAVCAAGVADVPAESETSPAPGVPPEAAAAVDDAAKLAQWRAGPAGRLLRGARVLIVDDDIRSVFALAQVLGRLGALVRYAENGPEGIEQVQGDPRTSLVLMDVTTPEWDGYQAIRAIRAMPGRAGLPIIAMTAGAAQGDRDESPAGQAFDHIPKPVDLNELLDLIGRRLGRAQVTVE
jgi:signal transduction histidine kinase/ActR/RegA family two-component response regulator